MRRIQQVESDLLARPRRWLVTGAAGFIGSHLVGKLLSLGQQVVGFDNFATGHPRNLVAIRDSLAPEEWSRFHFREGDVRELEACREACAQSDIVLHEAALGSVPRSIANPLATHETNVTGFLNMLVAARDAGVKRFVYASSSSVYGDHPDAVRRETVLGEPLSPYAASKRMNELYAAAFLRAFGMQVVGLRYFNVFGPRQDPEGPYAAVIPRWAAAMLGDAQVKINGDGETTRDFCYVANVIQANLLAATADSAAVSGELFNVGAGGRTTLLDLQAAIQAACARVHPRSHPRAAVHEPFRPGDVRHSQADIEKARRLMGYEPTHSLAQGLAETVAWYAARQVAGPQSL